MSLSNLVGQVLDGKYRIEKQLGRGGMGAVYLATHLGTDRPVAVKVIIPQFMLNDEFIERFRREAKAAGRMRHPNVVDVTDFGFAEAGGERVAYLVMEYLDGCTLAEVLAEESRLPIDWIVDILEQACSAVDEAHRAGIVHRDLKPDNIWLEPNRRGGYTVKVLDFGLAKHGEAPPPESLRPMITTTSPSAHSCRLTTPPAIAPRTELLEAATRVITQEQNKTTAQSTAKAESNTSEGLEAATRLIVPEASQGAPQASRQKEPETATLDLAPKLSEASTLVLAPQSSEGATHALTPQSSEAATLALAPESSEAGTLIQPASLVGNPTARHAVTSTADKSESATQMLAPETEEAETRIQPPTSRATPANTVRQTMQESSAQSTAPEDGLTRVGSILGTPAYMSPEQCRGLSLDARSDIYSFGVIAYQMLTGETPFKGDIHEVMRQHMEAAPVPIRDKRRKIPRKMAAVVMSALAKNPADRPPSAASFANALRASSDGTGKLLRRAFALYSEYFPVFFRLALVAYLPVFLVTLLFLMKDLLVKSAVLSDLATTIISIALLLLMFLVNFISSTIVSGVTIWFVMQLYVAPLRPLSVRSALRALKSRLKPLILTTLRVLGLAILFCIPLVIPGLIYLINSSLTAPVVIMENLRGRAAVQRSKQLVKRARLTVIAILLLQHLLIPRLVSTLVFGLFGVKGQFSPHSEAIVQRFAEAFSTLINVLVIPLVAMLTALLYLKVRQLGGERLKEMLDQFEQEEIPQTKWQKRMRDRLSSSSHATRSA
jgi:serine/threonine protein kinase